MSIRQILDATSFRALDAASRKAVVGLFDKKYQKGEKKALDSRKIFEMRHSLSVSLAYYGARLQDINPATFAYLDIHQKQAIEEELLHAFYIFSAQYQLDEVEDRRQTLDERSLQIKTCATLINRLREANVKETPKSQLEKVISESEKHAKYLGLKCAPAVATLMLSLTTESENFEGAGKTQKIKDEMGALNMWRLYWVWGGSFTSLMVSLLPDSFTRKGGALNVLASPSPITGYMSWVLYYLRFGINLSLLLKHTLVGPWMSEEEKKIYAGEKYPTWMRFKTQWHQRKFTLLNDSIWATANLACFFWLVGDGILGYFGNIATAALLFMDTCISIWRYCEEDTQHHKNLARYERDLVILNQKLQHASMDEKHKIQLEIKRLVKAKKTCEFDWRYKTYGLKNDVAYACGLMVAFAVMCGVLCPPSVLLPATALLLGVIGSALCFSLSVIYTGVNAGIDIAKVRASKTMQRQEGEALLKEFVGTKDERIKKQLYLEMQHVMADTEDKANIVSYQQKTLIREMTLKVMIPPLLFVSLVFMPLGIGLGVIAAGFALAVMTHLMIEKGKPGKSALPEMDEGAYHRFASLQSPTLDDLNGKAIKKDEKSGFFQTKPQVALQAPVHKEPLPSK